MSIPGKNGIPLWIGHYGFYANDKPDANGLQVWIKKSDGEGMGMTLDRFNDLMDKLWRDEF